MIFAAALALAASSPANEARAWEPALQAAERDLCGRQVALLGENGFHGDGKTPAFKAALIRRLVTRCGYAAVFFEASHYDFLAVERAVRRREPVTEAMVSSSIGGLWNQDEELAPLVAFLTAEAKAGRVTLGGLDDQVGSWRAFYSLDTMRTELAAFLPVERREPCKAALWQRMAWTYSEASPHDWTTVRRVQDCVGEMRAGLLASGADAAARDEYLDMLANIDRLMQREFAKPAASIAGRDQSMYFNFRWLAARLKAGTKIIVWAANQHVAKDPALAADFVAGGSLGAWVHREYKRRAFALGFSAAGGSFRWSRREAKPIPAAAPDSVEGLLIAGRRGDAGYAGPAALAALGTRPASFFDHRGSASGRWADVFDGAVVFRAERPPVRIDERD
jgi:erythromycin esterase-like protein